MIIIFEEKYLEELYTQGKANDKKQKLVGDKKGISSVKVNDQYRIEFIEEAENGKQIATICNITELSNHYK